MLGFVVVDDGRIGNVGYGFVLLVDGGVLGVDVSKVGAVVSVDIAVPSVVVDGNITLTKIGLTVARTARAYIYVDQ